MKRRPVALPATPTTGGGVQVPGHDVPPFDPAAFLGRSPTSNADVMDAAQAFTEAINAKDRPAVAWAAYYAIIGPAHQASAVARLHSLAVDDLDAADDLDDDLPPPL
jgi:hypothetical protein